MPFSPPFSSSYANSPNKDPARTAPRSTDSTTPPNPPTESSARQLKQPERGASGSSSAASTSSRAPSPSPSPSPARRDPTPASSRQGSGDAYSAATSQSGGSSAPGSRKNSGHEQQQEPTDPGLAGRGAGAFNVEKRGSGLPVLNTFLLPQGGGGGGLLSPTTSSSHSHGSGEGGYGASSSSSAAGGRHARDSPAPGSGSKHPLPPSSTSGSTTSPSTQNSSPAFPRSPSFGPGSSLGRGVSPSPSSGLPPSHSNSTLSSHSHSHSHSQHNHAQNLSPTTASFPHIPFPHPHSHSHHPPSRPSSAASNSRSVGGGTRSQNPSADGHDPPPAPAASSSSSSGLAPSSSAQRQRGDSGGSASASSHASSSRAASRERGGRSEGGEKRGAAGQALCAKCELPMTGQFVRALGTVYHLDCFRCMDCSRVVAAKFFPIDDPAAPSSGKQVPLCETDYFRRLNLLCNKCGQALRGSYITALDMKFHVEHFTCSVCPTVFGPQDSYYEHSGSVYCHFHYSTRFAVKCTGCRTAILKQFVEINRNNVDEHWHPECYMIHKFWNIKLAPTPKALDRPPSTSDPSDPSSASSSTPAPPPPPDYLAAEESETPSSLKARQRRMEEQVYRIWTILSAFEESSAACISEMLRHVSGGHYMEGVGMAEKFVLHVETLFAAIDDLNEAFRRAGAKEMAHVREARMLCKKVVNFFMLLSHTHETGARKMSITQELLSLVTGLAHYLKILIRIALTGSLRLERDHANPAAIGTFLGRLDRLARDPDANRISSTTAAVARAQAGGAPSPSTSRKNSAQSAVSSSSAGGDALSPTSPSDAPSSSPTSSSLTPTPATPVPTRQPYGYRSLTRAVGTLVGQGEATTDLCEGCRLTVEEECARLGTSTRWHLGCLKCGHCGRGACRADEKREGEVQERERDEVPVADFVWVDGEGRSPSEGLVALAGGDAGTGAGGGGGAGQTYCRACALRERAGSLEGTVGGFEYVTRLEQYAFLLCVALNKLFGRLKMRGVVPGSPPDNDETRSLSDAYRDSTDIKRMKSVQLDRKLSSTTARLPKRSTVVQSPSGRTAQSDDSSFALFQAKPPVPSRKDQPLVDPVRGTTIPRHQPPTLTNQPSMASIKPTSHHVSDREPPPPVPSIPSQTQTQSPRAPPALAPPVPSSTQSSPSRPAYNRTTTAVRIVDEPLPLSPTELRDPSHPRAGSNEPLGGASEPTQDEDGLTLADLPKALEAEQKRSARGGLPGAAAPGRHSPPFAGQGQATREAPLPSGLAGHAAPPPPHAAGPAGYAPYAAPAGPKLLSELSALEYFIVKHVAAVLLASSEASAMREVVGLEELLEIIDARGKTFWGKLFKGGEKKKEVKKKGVFGIPLDVLVDRNGADSMHGAGPGSLRIPSFVDDVISAMKQMDMSIEGIFRKNGNIRRLKDLTEALDRDSAAVNLSDDNPVQLAALLKKFLRDLPDPLMSFKLFPLFIAAQRILDESERKKVLHFICCLMPKPHRDTMEVLFVFLKWVASFSHVDEETGSKMDLQNLATVISPNILYAKGKDPARDESFSAARVVHELLEMQDEVWEVPAECLSILNDQELFANPSQLTSKEILARAENHIRSNGRGGWKTSAGVHISRGEASPPQRPGLQEAWSAPAVPGGGPSLRPLSTSVSPSTLRHADGRPLSFSNHLVNALNGTHLPPAGAPAQSRSGASTPGSNGAWPPPPAGRYEEPYRRGSSEGHNSSTSLHRVPQQRDQRDQRDAQDYPHLSRDRDRDRERQPAAHPYNQAVPVHQR
ncbi:hypothetical protein JCM10207_004729 [Rhodosporidiobolus poonsookiae]